MLPGEGHQQHAERIQRLVGDDRAASDVGVGVVAVALLANPTTPFLDRQDFPWAGMLENGWREIRTELGEVLARRDDLPNFQDILRDSGRVT